MDSLSGWNMGVFTVWKVGIAGFFTTCPNGQQMRKKSVFFCMFLDALAVAASIPILYYTKDKKAKRQKYKKTKKTKKQNDKKTKDKEKIHYKEQQESLIL